jgi:hypothetical protein
MTFIIGLEENQTLYKAKMLDKDISASGERFIKNSWSRRLPSTVYYCEVVLRGILNSLMYVVLIKTFDTLY